jgi:hypothetical protein
VTVGREESVGRPADGSISAGCELRGRPGFALEGGGAVRLRVGLGISEGGEGVGTSDSNPMKDDRTNPRRRRAAMNAQARSAPLADQEHQR